MDSYYTFPYNINPNTYFVFVSIFPSKRKIIQRIRTILLIINIISNVYSRNENDFAYSIVCIRDLLNYKLLHTFINFIL